MEKSSRVQAIDRAVQILNCFSERRPELQLREITEELGLNKSTVHGIINTLKANGLIDQDEDTLKYRLGTYLMKLGDLVSQSLDIVQIARPYLEEISDQVHETVHLATLEGAEVVYIDKMESTQSMRIATTRGARRPAYCTGVGKTLLAYVPMDQLDRILAMKPLLALTPKTVTDPTELKAVLADIRRQGVAYDHEENEIGLSCIAVPIFNQAGSAAYALSISMPTARMTEAKLRQTEPILRQAAEEISRRLGHS